MFGTACMELFFSLQCVCMNNQRTTSPLKKIGLDVIQSQPLCRMYNIGVGKGDIICSRRGHAVVVHISLLIHPSPLAELHHCNPTQPGDHPMKPREAANNRQTSVREECVCISVPDAHNVQVPYVVSIAWSLFYDYMYHTHSTLRPPFLPIRFSYKYGGLIID